MHNLLEDITCLLHIMGVDMLDFLFHIPALRKTTITIIPSKRINNHIVLLFLGTNQVFSITLRLAYFSTSNGIREKGRERFTND